MTAMPLLAEPSVISKGGSADFAFTTHRHLEQRRLANIDPATQATTLTQGPPAWLQGLFYWIQGVDGLPDIDGDQLRRLTRTVAQLPRTTPPPQVGIGDDDSIAMEWDFGPAHLGIQIDADPSYDAIFVDLDGDEDVTEAPLADGIGYLSRWFARLGDTAAMA